MVILAELSRSGIYGCGMAKHALNMGYREAENYIGIWQGIRKKDLQLMKEWGDGYVVCHTDL